MSDGAGLTTLTSGVNGGTVFISGGSLTATATDLMFDFNTSGAFVNFSTSPGCQPIWTLRTTGAVHAI